MSEIAKSIKAGFVTVTEENRRSIKSVIDIVFLGSIGAAFRAIPNNEEEKFFRNFASFIPKAIADSRPDELDEVIGFTIFDFSLADEDGNDIVFNDPSVSTIEEANEAFNRYIESKK